MVVSFDDGCDDGDDDNCDFSLSLSSKLNLLKLLYELVNFCFAGAGGVLTSLASLVFELTFWC